MVTETPTASVHETLNNLAFKEFRRVDEFLYTARELRSEGKPFGGYLRLAAEALKDGQAYRFLAENY